MEMFINWMKRLDPKKIGIVGTVGTAALGMLVLVLSVVPFGAHTYTAYFEHSAGLRVGESVQVAGVLQGDVTGIQLTERDGQKVVAVTFTVNRRVDMGSDTTAEIKIATLLGTHYLQVAPAGPGSLENRTIPVSQTIVPFNLQDVIEETGTSLRTYEIDVIAESLGLVAEAFGDIPEQTGHAFEGVAALTEVAVRRSDQLSQLLQATSDVTSDIARNTDDIMLLLNRANEVLAELLLRRDAIRTVLRDARILGLQIQGILEDNQELFDPYFEQFNILLSTLEEHEAGLEESIRGLATMAHYLSNATGNGPWLDLYIETILPDPLLCTLGAEGC